MTHPAIEKLADQLRAIEGVFRTWEQTTEMYRLSYLEMAEAAHRHILSEPPSVSMRQAVAEELAKKTDREGAPWDWLRGHHAANRARLRELGLSDD